MIRHMLVQLNLLARVGFWLAGALPRRWVERLNVWTGYLFESSPVRMCNACLLDDQEKMA